MPRFILLFILSLLIVSCKSNTKLEQENITVFAAAGVRMSADSIVKTFEAQDSVKVSTNYSSSGILARQIEQGAEADLFISANRSWIDHLQQKNLLQEHSIKEIGQNRLIVITQKGQTDIELAFNDKFDIRSAIKNKIAVGTPDHVPAGRYTLEAFEKLGWVEPTKNLMIQTKDVGSVFKYVEMGECDWGVVYTSLHSQSDKIIVVDTIPEHLHAPISFYIAQTKNASKASDRLYTRFLSEEGKEILQSFGFQTKKLEQ